MIRKSLPSDLIRGWVPVFPRDKREAFARRSCSDKKIDRDDDSKKSHPDLERRIAQKINEFAGRAESVLYENRGNITRTFGPNTLPHQLWIDLSVFDLNYLRDFITRHSSGTILETWEEIHHISLFDLNLAMSCFKSTSSASRELTSLKPLA